LLEPSLRPQSARKKYNFTDDPDVWPTEDFQENASPNINYPRDTNSAQSNTKPVYNIPNIAAPQVIKKKTRTSPRSSNPSKPSIC
jgi:hypothetical protein